MQHGEEPVPPSVTALPPQIPASSSPGDRLKDKAASSPVPQAEPWQGQGGDALSPGKPVVVVQKKSYTEAKDGGVQRGTRLPDEYGYVITDQK